MIRTATKQIVLSVGSVAVMGGVLTVGPTNMVMSLMVEKSKYVEYEDELQMQVSACKAVFGKDI